MSPLRLPTLFVSHGAPTLALEDSPAGRFLDGLAHVLPFPPRAIVVASAHFNRRNPVATASPRPRTIHDFRGFPQELYNLQYPVAGDPDLAARITTLLHDAGFEASADPAHGIDHGVWVPLRRAWPAANIPVVAISVNPEADAEWHVRQGRALSALRDDGVLIIGSGGFVHNLRELDPQADAAMPWAKSFADWLRDAVQRGNIEDGSEWLQKAPQAARAHPTAEHLYPLFVAWGAAGHGARGKSLHASWQFGSLALDAFAFESGSGQIG
ncbi:MAG: class III extradiol ring-cleavage dioxygenase [Tahibacter sp.]